MARLLIVTVIVVVVLGGLFFAPRPAPREEAGPQEREVDIAVQGDAMTPEEIPLVEGEQATLRITSDHPIEFHMHGYDLEEEVSPEEPAEVSFQADLTGRFEIEDEASQTELGALLVEPR